jgi:ADP-ribose pyrophosphatase YjhB (NUDIX family)
MDMMPLLDELRTIARNGLTYTTNPYDRERYERLLEIASTYYGQVLDIEPGAVRQHLVAELGYITPKVGVDAAIFDDEGRMLLVLRSDNGRWCLPCGWVDPNETPAQAVIREVREETGLEARITRLVDVVTRFPSVDYGLYTMVGIVYLCEAIGGALRPSHETPDVRYWQIEDVPIWHAQHREVARLTKQAWERDRGLQATEHEGVRRTTHD